MVVTEADPRIRIALRAQELKLVYLGLNLAATAMMHPDVPLLHWTRQLVEAGADDDVPVVLTGARGEEEKLSFSAQEVLTKLSALRGEVVAHDLLSVGMLLGATRLGDMIRQENLSRRDEPLLQFARHFRNAAAHGDRWSFHEGQPEPPAACRDLELTAVMNGRRATWETVTPKRYVEFLDDLSNYFVPRLVPPPNPPAAAWSGSALSTGGVYSGRLPVGRRRGGGLRGDGRRTGATRDCSWATNDASPDGPVYEAASPCEAAVFFGPVL